MKIESLNGHYCLVTKEHYDKLVEDGCRQGDMIYNIKEGMSAPYFMIENNLITPTYQSIVSSSYSDYKPMHLYNNEWVFGSLAFADAKKESIFKQLNEFAENNPEEFSRLVNKAARKIKPDPVVERIQLDDKYQDAIFRLGTDEMLLEDLSLNELKKITAKHEKEAANKYRKDAPKVERITRENELINKKHYDVLDHMLNGGKIKVKTTVVGDWRIIDNINDFILDYNESFTYEIIKDKSVCKMCNGKGSYPIYWGYEFNGHSTCECQKVKDKSSLNGHYCLATKEHYDKLVEDGYDNCTIGSLTYYYILHNRITSYNVEDIDHTKTMHLHNNEWVEGSLEHKFTDNECLNCGVDLGRAVIDMPTDIFCDGCSDKLFDIPTDKLFSKQEYKAISRITREEGSRMFMVNAVGGDIGNKIREDFNRLFDYIEYLEANQKEAQC